MLIDFNFSNFRSIQERQTFSMIAGRGTEMGQNIITTTDPGVSRVLKSAAIYGPNAGGKGNLVRALSMMKHFVINSSRSGQEWDRIPYEPFLLNKLGAKQPSEFEIQFIESDIRYQYGFFFNEHVVLEEWLYAWPKGNKQRWFYRKFNPKSNQTEWHFSHFFKGSKKVWQKSCRNNALFLSTAVQLNSEMLKPVMNWFANQLIPISCIQDLPVLDQNSTFEQCKNPKRKQEILKLLHLINPEIEDIHMKLDKQKDPEQELIKLVRFTHKTDEKNYDVQFDHSQESAGLLRMFHLSGIWIDLLRQGKVLVLDKLESFFHPLLVDFLIDRVHQDHFNPYGAQLIFTTHSIHLMEKQFRRDQFWFMKRDSGHASQLYSLAGMSIRKDEGIKKAYLAGKYGAIPVNGK